MSQRTTNHDLQTIVNRYKQAAQRYGIDATTAHIARPYGLCYYVVTDDPTEPARVAHTLPGFGPHTAFMTKREVYDAVAQSCRVLEDLHYLQTRGHGITS